MSVARIGGGGGAARSGQRAVVVVGQMRLDGAAKLGASRPLVLASDPLERSRGVSVEEEAQFPMVTVHVAAIYARSAVGTNPKPPAAMVGRGHATEA